ncbi:MAG: hypothetical protein J6W70_06705 [Lentisphaeria bacterium]|nr:hypothetical protein [Lentisphaeria bacterium]
MSCFALSRELGEKKCQEQSGKRKERVEKGSFLRHKNAGREEQGIDKDKTGEQAIPVKHKHQQADNRQRDIKVPPKESFIDCVLQMHGLSPENPFY